MLLHGSMPPLETGTTLASGSPVVVGGELIGVVTGVRNPNK